MKSSSILISIGTCNIRLNHLLIVGILILSFSMSFLVRSIPSNYGWELNEFDPFYNYRATQYMIENGYDSYLKWNDELSWYPIGRDVSANSQVSLHLITAISYEIFGGNMELYDYTIIFPVIIGSLSTIVIFALVRVIAGTSAGLLSSLFFSISLPIILRGQIGWLKSEPLGLFLGILATYLLLSGINSKNKFNFIQMILSGLVFALGFSAWGGSQFFIIPIGIFILGLAFLKNNFKTVYLIPIFLISLISFNLFFERPGIGFMYSLSGMALLFPTLFFISSFIIQKFSHIHHLKFNIIFLTISVGLILSIVLFSDAENSLHLPTHRYLNSLNPFLITSDPLTESVSEHTITQIRESFLFHSVLLIFGGLGIWSIFTSKSKQIFIKNEFLIFTLTTGFIGVYVAATFVRLEVFASLGIIIFSSIGISSLFKNFILKKPLSNNSKLISIFGIIGIISLILIPLIVPEENTIFSIVNVPPTIINGGSQFHVSSTDWLDTLEWIKNNTPQDSVIASWWDYGYWIQTKAERASIADNSTVNDAVIKRLASIFFEEPDNAWTTFQDMEVDYFVLFLAGERIGVDNQTTGEPLYALYGGGDESKKYWFAKIAGVPVEKYLESDLVSGTEVFWKETFLGKISPFQPIGYANFAAQQMSQKYNPGWLGIYEKNTDFVTDANGPFKLVYSSNGYDTQKNNNMLSVFVFEINDDYQILD